MPARTNDFQKLIKVINQRLAPTDAKITESAMLYDPEADTDREIDILVEGKLLNCNIKIGIECSTVQKPLDVRVIESFREKHRKVGINQTIVVSKNGFTKPAKNYAENNHIKLLTFNSAKSENWQKNFERFKNLSVYGRQYYTRTITATFSQDKADADFLFDSSVMVMDQGAWIPLTEFAAKLFTSSELSKHKAKELLQNEGSGPDPWVEVGFDLGEKYEFKDQAGKIVTPLSVSIVFDYKSKYRSLNTAPVTYDGTNMVAGGFFDDKNGDFAHVAINETTAGINATLELSTKFMPDLEGPNSSKLKKGSTGKEKSKNNFRES